MLQVYELLEIPLFQGFRLVAGEKGLNRAITNTTILEYETYIDGFHVFHAGDFILTSLFFAKDQPALIRSSFEELLARDVAGIAVKTSFYTELPREALDFAERSHLPVFLFDDTYMEDIIVGIDAIIKRKEAYLRDERILEEFLDHRSPLEVVKFAGQFCHFPYGQYVVACLSPASPEGPMERIFNRISYRPEIRREGECVSFVKYGERMILIYNFPSGRQIDVRAALDQQLACCSLRLSEFRCGVSEVQTELLYFDLALEQAIAANEVSTLKRSDLLTYAQIGRYQYIVLLLKNKLFLQKYESTVERLLSYDREHNTELFRTLRAYVHHSGRIAPTARELFQHENTIRYRLQKAEELTDAEDFYEYSYLVVHVYDMLNV